MRIILIRRPEEELYKMALWESRSLAVSKLRKKQVIYFRQTQPYLPGRFIMEVGAMNRTDFRISSHRIEYILVSTSLANNVAVRSTTPCDFSRVVDHPSLMTVRALWIDYNGVFRYKNNLIRMITCHLNSGTSHPIAIYQTVQQSGQPIKF